jgi:hypothetical protein
LDRDARPLASGHLIRLDRLAEFGLEGAKQTILRKAYTAVGGVEGVSVD